MERQAFTKIQKAVATKVQKIVARRLGYNLTPPEALELARLLDPVTSRTVKVCGETYKIERGIPIPPRGKGLTKTVKK